MSDDRNDNELIHAAATHDVKACASGDHELPDADLNAVSGGWMPGNVFRTAARDANAPIKARQRDGWRGD